LRIYGVSRERLAGRSAEINATNVRRGARTMKHALLLALVPAALALTAPAALAKPAGLRVEYADLNLNSEAGAEVMLRRLNRAAASVCGDSYGRRPIEAREAVRACMSDAVERAVSALDHPTVTALYRGRDLTIAHT
jgi:UrcA family protein